MTTQASALPEVPERYLGHHIFIAAWERPGGSAEFGFLPRSAYVENCWLPLLGPTAGWLYRRLGAIVNAHPAGFQLPLRSLVSGIGLTVSPHPRLALAIATEHLAECGLVCWGSQLLYVLPMAPPLTEAQVKALPRGAQLAHECCMRERVTQL